MLCVKTFFSRRLGFPFLKEPRNERTCWWLADPRLLPPSGWISATRKSPKITGTLKQMVENPQLSSFLNLWCVQRFIYTKKKTCGQNIVGISTSCRERPTWKAVLILKSLLSLTSKLWEIHAAFTLVPACRKWFEWTNSAKIIKTLKEKSVWINSCWLCFGIYISYPDTQLRCSASIGPSTTVSDILRTTINSLGQRRLPYKVVNRIIYHTSLYKYAISMHVRIQYVHYLHQYAFQTSYQ